MSPDPPPWREFTYPLNVFMHILSHEEGDVRYLHYGLFESDDERLDAAQARSTELLLSRLPPPPCRVLDVGVGLATTLRHLIDLGYDAEGITPDASQIAAVQARFGDALPVHHARFEVFEPEGQRDRMRYGVIVFQESSQYIHAEALFAQAARLAPRVVVLDEFALRPLDVPGALHALPGFIATAACHGFAVTEELDLSAKAAPTMAYFTDRIPAYRTRLIADLGLTSQQIDDLIASGAQYRQRYADGTYGYRLLSFARSGGDTV